MTTPPIRSTADVPRRVAVACIRIALDAALAAAIVFAVLAATGLLRPEPLSNLSPITVHQQSGGVDVIPPSTMAVWQYAGPRLTYADNELRHAVESDLHAGDSTFHRTHELIDGREW